MDSAALDIAGVLSETGARRSYAGVVDVPILTLGAVEFRLTAPARFDLDLSNTGGSVLVQGTVSVETSVDCCRCLRPFRLELTADVETLLVRPDDVGLMPEDADFVVVETDLWEAGPYLLSALAEVAPFAPVHAEDCRGICPGCGADLNECDCDCDRTAPESPFARLKDMFDTQEG